MLRSLTLIATTLFSCLTSAYTPNPELNTAANAFLEITDHPPSDSYYYLVGFGAKDAPIEAGKARIEYESTIPYPRAEQLDIPREKGLSCLPFNPSCMAQFFAYAQHLEELPEITETLNTRLQALSAFDDFHSLYTHSQLPGITFDTFALQDANRFIMLKATYAFMHGEPAQGIEQLYQNMAQLRHLLSLVDHSYLKETLVFALNDNLNLLSEMAIRSNDPSLFQEIPALTLNERSLTAPIANRFRVQFTLYSQLPEPADTEKALFYSEMNDLAEQLQPLTEIVTHPLHEVSTTWQNELSFCTPGDNATITLTSCQQAHPQHTNRLYFIFDATILYQLDAKIALFNAVYVDQNPTPVNPFDSEQASIIKDGKLCAPIPDLPRLAGDVDYFCLLLP